MRPFTVTVERSLARCLQLVQRALLDLAQPAIQVLDDLSGQFLFIHSEIPLFFKSAERACTALEQCVLTLPSEQPIAVAASATSSSSQ